MFGGLRISELLGLADDAVIFPKSVRGGRLEVRERLCSVHVTLGPVKTKTGLRDVPIGPGASGAVRAWRLARGPSVPFTVDGARKVGRLLPAPPGLRFGALWGYQDFRRELWMPLMQRAGLTQLQPDKNGKKRRLVAFSPHTLRHVYASIQIESGVTPKRLQALMGHATLAMTMDLYGHLWSDPDGDQALVEAAERVISKFL
jgi:integrase